LVPLCLWGNKQPHYLLPLLPPVTVLAGWLLDHSISGAADAGLVAWVRGVWVATVIVLAMAAPGVVLWGRLNRGHVAGVDVAAAACVCAAIAAVVLAYRLRRLAGGVCSLAASSCALIVLLVGVWGPASDSATPRTVAEEIRGAFGPGPYVFYRGAGENLPLAWYLGGIVPRIESESELAEIMIRHPRLVLIQAVSKRPADSDGALGPAGRRQIFEDAERCFIVEPGASSAAAANREGGER
jgi:hypothetical protein